LEGEGKGKFTLTLTSPFKGEEIEVSALWLGFGGVG